MPIMLAALLLQAAPPVTVMDRMAALYDEICLQTFPIDTQLDALMARKGAQPMTPEQVKVTLRDDPGRGWWLTDNGKTYTVMLELPPYHACSVRTNLPAGTLDLSAYDAVAKRFTATHAGFARQPPMDADQGDLHLHADSEYRTLPGGGGEHLMVIDQQINDPKRRAAGETGHVLRFVHQLTTKG